VKITVKEATDLIGFLAETYPDSPRTRIKKLLKNGAVRVNGRAVTLHSFELQPGDVVDIGTYSGKLPREVLPFKVLYEDNDVIAVDKPAGLSTSSTDGSKSILWFISEALKANSKGKVRAFVVHRLDKEVSGVLLFAKSSVAMDIIKDNWEKVGKKYFAVVEKAPEKSEGTVSTWLIEDKTQKMHSTFEREGARFAVTHYKVIKQLQEHVLLEVNPETGRKNQIRVHLSDIGCPIAGEYKYGAAAEFKRRIRLHAFSLIFPHPVSQEMITVESPMPEGFLAFRKKDEHYK